MAREARLVAPEGVPARLARERYQRGGVTTGRWGSGTEEEEQQPGTTSGAGPETSDGVLARLAELELNCDEQVRRRVEEYGAALRELLLERRAGDPGDLDFDPAWGPGEKEELSVALEWCQRRTGGVPAQFVEEEGGWVEKCPLGQGCGLREPWA